MSGRTRAPPLTSDLEPQLGSFATTTSVSIPRAGRLDVAYLPGAGDTINLTVTLRLGGTLALSIAAGGVATFDGREVSAIASTSGTASPFVWAIVGQDHPQHTFGSARPASSFKLTDFQILPPTSIAAATPETVEQLGANAILLGRLIRFNLCVVGTTAAGALVWVGLKLHTAATYIVTCSQGAVFGSMRMPIASDTIDIVVRNADGAAHLMSASWGVSPLE